MSSEGTGRQRTFTATERRRRFGRYETLFRIAGGGMAEVYAARIVGEAGFEKVVALKRMLPTLAEDDRFVEMFLDEGRLAANISSPYVVQTLDLGRADDDSLYLVMELVVGVPLAQLLREVVRSGKHLDTGVAVEIVAQAALGLHDAHEATTPTGEPMHIVHRDVSPQNIIVDRNGRTRILDFGVARAMQRSSHTQTGEVKGKMAYFAPEQASGTNLDRRVDIFALGVVAWECLAGRRLFKADNPLRTLQKITQEPIPKLLEVRPNLDPRLSEVVDKALQRDREQRYATAREFALALRSCLPADVTPAHVGAYVQANGGETLALLERSLKLALSESSPGLGLSASPDPSPDSAPALAEPIDDPGPVSHSQIISTTPASAAARPRSRARWLAVGAAVLLVAVVGVGVAVFGAGRDAAQPTDSAAPPGPSAASAPSSLTVDPPPAPPEPPASPTAEAPAEAPSAEPPSPAPAAASPRPRRPAPRSAMRRIRRLTMAAASPAATVSPTAASPTMRASSSTTMSAGPRPSPPPPHPSMAATSSPMTSSPMTVRMVLRGIDEFDSH